MAGLLLLLRPRRWCLYLVALLAAVSTLLTAALHCISGEYRHSAMKDDWFVIVGQYLAYRAYVLYARLRLAFFGQAMDTSWDGQAEFVAQDAQRHKISPGWVVDIGAHDGVWLSNSFFFVQRGFQALLVEAAPDTYRRLVDNLQRWRRTAHTCLAAIGLRNGELVRIVKSGWLDGTMNHVESDMCYPSDPACVNSTSLPTLLLSHGVPSAFFLLSLDVELGQDQYLRMIMDMLRANFTPSYIIAENVHDADATDVMTWFGYQWIEHFRYDAVYRRIAMIPGQAHMPVAVDHGPCKHIAWPLQAKWLRPMERVLRDFHARRRLLAWIPSQDMETATQEMLKIACSADAPVLQTHLTEKALSSLSWLAHAGEQLHGATVQRYEGTWEHPEKAEEEATWAVLTVQQRHASAIEGHEIILTAFPLELNAEKASMVIDYLQQYASEIRSLGLWDAASNLLLAYAKEYNAKHTSQFEVDHWTRQFQEISRVDLEFSALCSAAGIKKPFPGFYRIQFLRVLLQLAGCYEQTHKTSLQVAVLERAVPKFVQTYGAHHPELVPVLTSLSQAYQKLGNSAKHSQFSAWLSRITLPITAPRRKGLGR